MARLMLAHPDLPVLKLHTEADEDDNYVLKLTGARIGTWWLADERVWDDYEDACYALGNGLCVASVRQCQKCANRHRRAVVLRTQAYRGHDAKVAALRSARGR